MLVQVCAPCAPTQFWEMSSQDFGLPPVHSLRGLAAADGGDAGDAGRAVAAQLVAEPQLPACAPPHAPATKPRAIAVGGVAGSGSAATVAVGRIAGTGSDAGTRSIAGVARTQRAVAIATRGVAGTCDDTRASSIAGVARASP